MLTFGNVQIVDLSSIFAVVASWGVVPTLVTWLRRTFLNRLLSGLSPDEQNQVLTAVVYVLTALLIVVVAVGTGHLFSWELLLSAVVQTFIGAHGAGRSYTYNYKDQRERIAASMSSSSSTTTDNTNRYTDGAVPAAASADSEPDVAAALAAAAAGQ